MAANRLPSDAAIIKWAEEEQFFLFCSGDEILDIVRSALQHFRQPDTPARDAVDLAREGMELYQPGQPEYIVCAELVRIADAARKEQL